MTEFDLKAYREWQQSNDRHTFHGIGGEVHALTGIVRALIATHPDPASVERYFEEWNRVESKRLEDLEACRLEGLPEDHPDKNDEDWPQSDHDFFIEGWWDVVFELRDVFKRALISKRSRPKNS